MNWLAHALLSKPDIAFRVGNILPDLVSITELKNFSPAFQEGIRCHQAIDIFTDSHPIVRSGINRLPENYRRYGGILTDVFYDHFLAKNWAHYSPISLHTFTNNFYRDLQLIENDIPADILAIFQRMLQNKIFENNKDISGIKMVLQRIDVRLRRPANLGAAIVFLEENYDAYEMDFCSFFPALKKHIQPHINNA